MSFLTLALCRVQIMGGWVGFFTQLRLKLSKGSLNKSFEGYYNSKMIYHFLLGSKWVVLWIKSQIHALWMSWKSWAPYSLLYNSHNDLKCYRQKPHTGNSICEKMWAQRVFLATGVLLLKGEMKNRLPSVQWDLIVRSQWKSRALRFLTWVFKGP